MGLYNSYGADFCELVELRNEASEFFFYFFLFLSQLEFVKVLLLFERVLRRFRQTDVVCDVWPNRQLAETKLLELLVLCFNLSCKF